MSGLAGTKDKIEKFLTEDPREALLKCALGGAVASGEWGVGSGEWPSRSPSHVARLTPRSRYHDDNLPEDQRTYAIGGPDSTYARNQPQVLSGAHLAEKVSSDEEEDN